jgi:hypothetical protein
MTGNRLSHMSARQQPVGKPAVSPEPARRCKRLHRSQSTGSTGLWPYCRSLRFLRAAHTPAAVECLARTKVGWRMSPLPALLFCHELHQHTLLAATQRLRGRLPGRLVRPYPLLQVSER